MEMCKLLVNRHQLNVRRQNQKQAATFKTRHLVLLLLKLLKKITENVNYFLGGGGDC